MKKIFLSIFIFFLFITNVQAKSVEIVNSNCSGKTNGILNNNISTSFDGLNLNIDSVIFSKEGDYLNCNIEINNSYDKTLQLDKSSITSLSNDNITYTLESDNNYIIKKGQKKIFNLKIDYKKITNEEKTINNDMEIKLVEMPNNPNTGSKLLISSLVILFIILLLVYFVKKNKKLSFFVVMILLSLTNVYALNTILLRINSEINLVNPTYLLKIDPDGGSYENNLGIQEYNIKRGDTKEISVPSKTGYTFNKWIVEGNSSKLVDNIFTMGDEDTLLKATWTANKYILTIKKENGEADSTIEIEYNKTVTVNNPLKEGYTFTGWTVDGGTLSGTSFTQSDARNSTLTANYVANNYSYLVTHSQMNLDGTTYTLVDADSELGEKEYGMVYTPNTRTYLGFTSPEERSLTIQVDTNPPTKNILNYNYSRNKYSLTLRRNNGEEDLSYNMYYKETKTITNPSKTGYNFSNWSVSGGTLNNQLFTMGADNAILSANYTPIEYTISYVLNGGTLENPRNTYTIESDTFTLGTPTKEGYIFKGWKTSNNEVLDEVTIPRGSYGNKTYTAKWQAIKGTLSRTWASIGQLDKTKIESVEILPTLGVSDDAIVSFDGSIDNDESVMIYTLDEDNDALYEVYITGNGGVYAPENSSELFSLVKENNYSTVSNLVSLKLAYLDTTKVTNMKKMFYEDIALTELDLSGFSTTNVTDMSYMFRRCIKLPELDISSFNTTNVTNMSYMFSALSSITELDLNNLDTTSVTNMSYMFGSNVTPDGRYEQTLSKLEHIDLSNFNTAKVTNMQGMFGGCTKLQELDLSGFDTSSVTDMSYMFSNVVTGWTANHIENRIIVGTSTLTDLDLSGFNTSNVTNISHMFIGCKNLKHVDFTGWDTSKVTNMSSMFGVHYNDSMFSTSTTASCMQLETVDLSPFDTSKVTNMTQMFYNCRNLKTIYVDEFDTSSVTSGVDMFYRCDSLVGQNGTTFNSSNITFIYARIDTAETPGYFTHK